VKIFVASDHAGFHLRQRVLQHLRAHKREVVDLGPSTAERSDYPDYAAPTARQVRDTEGALGILVCGSGVGMCIAANKVHGVRAADGFCIEAARLARSHNDANIICLGERLLPPETALAVVDAFLNTPFDGGRHTARVEKVAALEKAEAQAIRPGGAKDV
jgi:ribose 5-phosphate isomerase B